jgi:MSHA biogenesis protein MshM
MTYDTHNDDPSNLDQLNQVKPNYLAAYGLTEAPFSLQQDDRFFYSSAALDERLDLLRHYTQYGNLLLIITGERGIGKSSLKQRFINTKQEEWQICEIQAHTMMDTSLLLRQAAVGFGLTDPPLEPSFLYDMLSDQIERLHQESYVPILIIDDAHELPQEALQALLYLAEHHSNQETALLRIILFCEPEIETMLEDPAIHSLKKRVTNNMEVPSLDETQTAEYLRHRLAVAGLDGTSTFTPKLIHKIFKASKGIPSKINEYAHKNLIDDSEPPGFEEMDLDNELFHTETRFNLRNMLLGGFALAIVITVLLFQKSINNLFTEPEHVIIETKQNQTIPTAQKTTPVITQKIKNIPEVEQTKIKTIEFELDKEPPIKIGVEEKPTKNITNNPGIIKLSAINPSPVLGSKQRQIISIKGSGFHKQQKIKISWTGKEKILSATQVNVASDTYINLTLNVGVQADTWNVTVIDPVLKIESNTISFDVIAAEKENTTTKTATKKSKNTSSLHGQKWITQQNKNHFTMQLLGTHQKNTLPAYLKKFSLKNDAAIFKTKRDGKDWFTLIYGFYPTKSAAQAAAKQLPKGVSKPWIRSFASILPSLSKKSAVINTAKTIPTPPLSSNQEGWLWSQNPNHYTLQLTASTSEKAIQAFIKQHHLDGKAIYFHRLRDGKNWYILIHSSYSSYAKAKQAISQLPLAVQKAGPWARQFSAIHDELN